MDATRYSMSLVDDRKQQVQAEATALRFSASCCFAPHRLEQSQKQLAVLADFLISKKDPSSIALFGDTALCKALLQSAKLEDRVCCILTADPGERRELLGLPVMPVTERPSSVKTVFVCEISQLEISRARRQLPDDLEIITPQILPELDLDAVPEAAWVPAYESIYPIEIPEIEFLPGQDMILIDCPSRNLGLMPNGLAYVHNALKKEGIQHQTVDLSMIIYHRFHTMRILDSHGCFRLSKGLDIPPDPWMNENMGLWSDPDFIEFFRDEIDEIVAKLEQARPRIVGLSISQTNEMFSNEVINGIRRKLPETSVVVGGFSCLHPVKGLWAFPNCDYLVVGEADLTIGPLVRKILNNESPKDLPGVLSYLDSPFRDRQPGPLLYDLEAVEIPKYDWTELSNYRNFNHYLLVPIVANRGCHWSNCRFCGERFKWRPRDPVKFVDEIEWLYKNGCQLFVVNDSDLNGDPAQVMAICDEIIRRDLKVRLSGQLRIDRRNTPEFFSKLKKAGYHMLRFGVDAWAKNTLKIQCKGYAKETIRQNLRDCFEAGIFIEVNAVIGVPGETEADIDETIEFLKENQDYIYSLSNLNPLILITGSEFWFNPEEYNIKFREDQESLYLNNINWIPSHAWYSTEPYIDEQIRIARCRRIVESLSEVGFNFGVGAEPIIRRLKSEEVAAKKSVEILTGGDIGAAEENLNSKPTAEIVAKLSLKPKKPDGTREPSGRPRSDTEWSCRIENPCVQEGQKVLRYDGRYLLPQSLPEKAFFAQGITSAHVVDITRLNPSGMEMVRENVSCYNIIKVFSDYYAVRHGYPFEIDWVDKGKYAKGVCLKADSIPELENLIRNFS